MFVSSLLALGLVALPSTLAQKAGTYVEVGDTLVSAMMMFLGNDQKVYILDKTEGNAQQINNHPAWAAIWDLNSNQATAMDMQTNPFCAAGMHLPNGSFATFGGNGAITIGGDTGSEKYPGNNFSAIFDQTYQDYDGRKAIRIIDPCEGDVTQANCAWYDSPNGLQMSKARWYPGIEPLADGSVVLIGGFTSGGYINRNTDVPTYDPLYEGGAAEPTFEFYPSRGGDPQVMQFMGQTAGLNAYAHTYLLPSGKMLVQANISTIIWDYNNNIETPLPPMPKNVVRVYPASGAVAMLPLTPANNYTPTVLFCGGSDMPDEAWGNYSNPVIDTFYYPASPDCQRLTPEPADGSQPAYEQDDDMPVGRTMGQFIALPDGTLLVLNGGANGTAGYATNTAETLSYSDMPYGMSLAAAPVTQPAVYNPNAPKGSRWSQAGMGSSNIPRLYHSSAILLPDGSVFVAGSNPNVDVNLTTYFPTTYKAEIFYPSYFNATTRPQPQNVPTKLTYGGNPFDITIPASSYSGSSNAAADNTTVWLMRGGFTTHAMNMGQRAVQLNNTYTVNNDGSIVLHVAQPPPNPNLFQPGPGMVFVTINGIPSNATMVSVGNGQIGTQPTSAASVLPASVRVDSASGSGSGSDSSSNGGSNQSSSGNQQKSSASHTGPIVGGVVAAVAAVGILGAVLGICLARRRRAAVARAGPSSTYPMSSTNLGGDSTAAAGAGRGLRSSDSSAFVPLQGNMSTTSLNTPYYDNFEAARGSEQFGRSGEFDPYETAPRMSTSAGPPRY
ncbi:DUF1929-domain-containing protein [Dentipellis sp. KUC8613]|nr:DUF1929-domain-containing protein [Dentipellis sp. KUC8613]